MLKLILIIFSIGVVILFVLARLLTYGSFLGPWGSSWVIQSDKTIDGIKFFLDQNPDSADVYVYMYSNGRASKLSRKDRVLVNGQTIQSELYHNGVSSAYRYTSKIPKAQEYILIIKRVGHEDVKKTIQSKNILFEIPSRVSKGEDLTIPYSTDQTSPLEIDMSSVVFSSLTEYSSELKSGAVTTTSSSREFQFYDEEMKIEPAKIIIEKEKLKNLINGQVNLGVKFSFNQEDGTLGVSSEKLVEIVE